MCMENRNQIMIRASSKISDYLERYPGTNIDEAIELYIQDHYYPEMNVEYRKNFLKYAATKYPPKYAVRVKIR